MPEVGELIDIWIVEKALGQGGSGSVYRCHNQHAPRIMAAVKVLESGMAGEGRTRFLREAEVLHSLDHPNIVQVRNVRFDASPPYIEMEFIEGSTIKHEVRAGPLRLDIALEFALQLATAVDYLHDRGIYHRDIKPSNVVISRSQQLKLVDFGLVLDTSADDEITQGNFRLGTLAYTPPEWTENDIDAGAWDIYAQGLVLYEMLTGTRGFRTPLGVPRTQRMLRMVALKQMTEFLDPGEEHPEEVRAAVRYATQRDPADRPASAREWMDLVEQLVELYGADPTDTTQIRRVDLDNLRQAAKRISQENERVTLPARAMGMLEAAAAPLLAAGPAHLVWVTLGVQIIFTLALVGAFLFVRGGAKAQDVVVVPMGMASGEELSVRLGDQLPTRIVGSTLHFAQVPLGAVVAHWAAGPDCGRIACPGEACPATCRTGTLSVDISASGGTQLVELSVGP